MNSGPLAAGRAGLVDDVVGVEVTIDGMLVIADRLHLIEFPAALGIRQNIPQDDLRKLVWEQVERDLTAQGVLNELGQVHPTVAAIVDTLSRPDRTLEGRWWRSDVGGGVMVRFAVCRKGDRHVIAARHDELIALQLVAAQVGLAGMVTAVLGPATPANVEPLTGVATELAECTTAAQLAGLGVAPATARVYAEIVGNPDSWVEIIAGERHPGGTYTQTDVAAGVLDSPLGRLVSLPRRVHGELYGSFLSGSQENLQRTLDGLLEFLPSRAWLDQTSDDESAHTDHTHASYRS
ncbi:ESX secretion-associated protein EspG [Mycobacterium sp. Aquia_213]|uniref:ESX secretion-associated protein EspG n=1 Tax=Mycobacterium sp. Aquia_213 TaxID=2991728 RepID=UPI0022703C16|nr:ESX secretion-associated protein EspG [Mycobacterium sp. Aquia_213]WAC91711.1 ESX secretion-associated protein EspG [Mycobacterium sp. Aquia_213]